MEKEWNYTEIVEALKQSPSTVLPAFLAIAVETAYSKNVFLPGGASNIVKSIEKRLRKEKI